MKLNYILCLSGFLSLGILSAQAQDYTGMKIQRYRHWAKGQISLVPLEKSLPKAGFANGAKMPLKASPGISMNTSLSMATGGKDLGSRPKEPMRQTVRDGR